MRIKAIDRTGAVWIPVVLAVVCLPLQLQAAETKAATNPREPLRIVAGPYLQAPSEDGVTIVWATNKPCTSKVRFGEGTRTGWTAVSTRIGLVDANETLHKIRLNDLEPGTTYRYRAGSKEITRFQPYKVEFGETVESGDFSFTTLDRSKERFSFLVLNDRHEKVPELRTALTGVDWKGVDLVFGNGDMYSHLETERQVFEKLIEPCCDFFAQSTPLVLVRGNHETRGAFARNLIDYFPSPNGRFHYSFDHAGVHFIVLDTGEDKADSTDVYAGLVDFDRYRSEQAEWLKKDIETPACRKARFRVAFMHIPPHHGNDWHGERDLRKKWVPILNKGRIDLLICGHTHKYARHAAQKDSHRFPILIGAPDTVLRIDVADRSMAVFVRKDGGSVVEEFAIPARRRFPIRLPWMNLP